MVYCNRCSRGKLTTPDEGMEPSMKDFINKDRLMEKPSHRLDTGVYLEDVCIACTLQFICVGIGTK